jgi:hypothetical protein
MATLTKSTHKISFGDKNGENLFKIENEFEIGRNSVKLFLYIKSADQFKSWETYFR